MTSSAPRSLFHDPRALALLLAASLTVMAAATISPALPGLERQFPDTPENAWLIRFLVPAPSFSVVLSAALCGLAVERFGRRPLLLAGVMLLAVSGSAGLVLQDLHLLLISRFALGLALAMIMTAQSALMGDYYTGDALHALTAAQVAARNFGGFAFITLAGALASISTRLPFVIYALPALMLPFLARAIAEPARPDRTAVQQMHPEPTSWRLLVLLLSLGQGAVTMLFFTMPTQLPFYLASRGADAPALTGAILGALMIAGGLAALLYPRLRGGFGDGWVSAAGLAAMGVGFACVTATALIPLVFMGAVLIGMGYALAIPGFTARAIGLTPAHRRGATGAMLTASVFLGQFVSPLLSIPAITCLGWQAAGTGLAALLMTSAAIVMLVSLRHGSL